DRACDTQLTRRWCARAGCTEEAGVRTGSIRKRDWVDPSAANLTRTHPRRQRQLLPAPLVPMREPDEVTVLVATAIRPADPLPRFASCFPSATEYHVATVHTLWVGGCVENRAKRVSGRIEILSVRGGIPVGVRTLSRTKDW